MWKRMSSLLSKCTPRIRAQSTGLMTFVVWRCFSCAVGPKYTNSVLSGFSWRRRAAHQRWRTICESQVTHSMYQVTELWPWPASVYHRHKIDKTLGWLHPWRLTCVRWTQKDRWWSLTERHTSIWLRRLMTRCDRSESYQSDMNGTNL